MVKKALVSSIPNLPIKSQCHAGTLGSWGEANQTKPVNSFVDAPFTNLKMVHPTIAYLILARL